MNWERVRDEVSGDFDPLFGLQLTYAVDLDRPRMSQKYSMI